MNERNPMQRRALMNISGSAPLLMVFLVALLWMGCEEEIPPVDENTIVVTSYNGPRLSASDSWTYDREEGLINKWYAYLSGDSVVIERDGLCGASCTEQYHLALLDRGTPLPRFRGCAHLKIYTYPVTRTLSDSLVSGEIRIQDWDLTGIVSGRVDGRWRTGDSLSFIFWADVMAEKVELVMSSYYSYEYPLINPIDDASIDENTRMNYQEDADRLALRIMQGLGGEATAESEIDTELSNTIYQALLHIYSSDDFAARDSVVDLYAINTWPDPEMNRLIVRADSSTLWMQAWSQDFQTTGNTTIDSLLETYGLEVVDYIRGSSKSSTHSAVLLSPQRRNIDALAELFRAIEGMDAADPDVPAGEGSDISVWAGDNSWQVEFSLGWGDCLNGCSNRYTWTFAVSYAGDVDYLGSSGPDIPAVLN